LPSYDLRTLEGKIMPVTGRLAVDSEQPKVESTVLVSLVQVALGLTPPLAMKFYGLTVWFIAGFYCRY
jgi:hypothetical protein